MGRKKKIKKVLLIFGIIFIVLFFTAFLTGIILMRQPSVRYLVYMSKILEPSGYSKREIFLPIKDGDFSVMVYRPQKNKGKRNFILIHGLTQLGNKHPKIDRMAASICAATGMNVFIPMIAAFNKKGLTYNDVTKKIAAEYAIIYRKFPGTYRAFGACFGGVALLGALNRLPEELYPEKILLYGPFANGKQLLNFYNKINANVDFIAKLAISSRMDIFSDKERALLRRAARLSGPGTTDKSQIKRIIGTRLFNTISVIQLKESDLESVGVKKIFPGNKKIPDSKYYILHSKGDSIVPISEGLNLFHYMKSKKANVNFFGTELFSHTENRVTVTGFLKEIKYLNAFFSSFFSEDIDMKK